MTRSTIAVFLVALTAAVSWAIATPLFASPDEPAHVIKAAGVARGQLTGSAPDNNDEFGARSMRLPARFAAAHNAECFAFAPGVTAECLDYSGPSETDDVVTTAGRHPPFYYAIVGVPSLLDTGSRGVYLMRMLSSLVTAGFLASAWVLLGCSARPGIARLGLAVAVTPMLLFLSGVVNPSAWEIAAAILLWSAGLAAIRGPVRPVVIHAGGVASVTLVLSRQLGPMWLVLILATLGALAGTSIPRELWRYHATRVWSIAAGAAVAFQGAWILSMRTLDTGELTDELVRELGTVDRIEFGFGRVSRYYSEMIGVFGWLDTVPPEWTTLAWTAAVFGLAVVAIALGRRAEVLTIVAMAIATIVIPVAAQVDTAPDVGFYWQGRYSLPFAVGIPIIAAWIVSRYVTLRPRALVTIGLGLGSAQVVAYAQALRRYASGARSDDLLFWNDAAWTPPIPILLCLGVFTAAMILWYRLVLADGTTPDAPPSDGRSDPSEVTPSARGAR